MMTWLAKLTLRSKVKGQVGSDRIGHRVHWTQKPTEEAWVLQRVEIETRTVGKTTVQGF